jgi:hypothetical protein
MNRVSDQRHTDSLTDRDLSSHITKEANAEAIRRLDVYRDWFNKVVIKANSRNAIVLIPIEEVSPRYRDETKSDVTHQYFLTVLSYR